MTGLQSPLGVTSSKTHAPLPLTFKDLAARWQITEDQAKRRVKRLGVPAFNVGPPAEPEWRFRLATVEAWEANNEQDIWEAGEAGGIHPPKAVLAAAPPGWDGVDRLKLGERKKGRPPKGPAAHD